jgi:hypothetical protein
MKAAVGRRYGSPDVVTVSERPVPRPRVDAGHKKGNIVVTMA